MYNVALYAGSFDPVTLGHLDVIQSAAKYFDKIIVALVKNPMKPANRIEQRMNWLKHSVTWNCQNLQLDQVSFYNFLDTNALTVDIARELKANRLIRGVKGVMNMEEEMQLAFNNKKLNPEIETVWLPVTQENYHISSTAVRTILKCSQNENELSNLLSKYLPSSIIPDIIQHKALFD